MSEQFKFPGTPEESNKAKEKKEQEQEKEITAVAEEYLKETNNALKDANKAFDEVLDEMKDEE